jgi:hypothetical protein
MSIALALYSAGILATLATGYAIEARLPPRQRNPLSSQLGLALMWPLYMLFLVAVAVSMKRH